jgi:hypothetical protein
MPSTLFEFAVLPVIVFLLELHKLMPSWFEFAVLPVTVLLFESPKSMPPWLLLLAELLLIVLSLQ